MPPGSTSFPPASISRAPPARSLPRVATTPSLMATSQETMSAAVATVPLRITRSYSLTPRPFSCRSVERYCKEDEKTRKGIEMAQTTSHRPTIAVTQHAISAGHYLAATAGFEILQAGGNAVDAGCAAGIALGVLQSDLVDVAGVAPIMIYLAEKHEVVTIAGLGPWPKALDPQLFQHAHGGKIPKGVLRTVVPAAPDAWITALRRYGTMSFGDVRSEERRC